MPFMVVLLVHGEVLNLSFSDECSSSSRSNDLDMHCSVCGEHFKDFQGAHDILYDTPKNVSISYNVEINKENIEELKCY